MGIVLEFKRKLTVEQEQQIKLNEWIETKKKNEQERRIHNEKTLNHYHIKRPIITPGSSGNSSPGTISDFPPR